ncbi:hypothetical protein CEXT_199241 [Caerostris extrusa]|uniref:Uncharacterized protein n=1 Tax=Caerostris extrusa TaxID=172846 RepID=A0AAV4WU73_CAEEX|nr:hypothetical protein CEXT_199241 [Caerostris extrusa]
MIIQQIAKSKTMVEVCPAERIDVLPKVSCSRWGGGNVITQPFLEGSGRCREAAARGTEIRQTRKKAPGGMKRMVH